MKSTAILGACALALTAASCDKPADTAAVAAPQQTEESAAKTVVEGGATAAEGLAEAAGAKKKGWTIEVEGVDVPKLEGRMVMAQTVGPKTTYKLGGGGAMVNITLKDVKKHQPGTFDPYSVSVMWLEDKMSCGYSALTKDGGDFKLVVVEKGEGIRADFEGDVRCSKVGSSNDERVEGTMKGWFED